MVPTFRGLVSGPKGKFLMDFFSSITFLVVLFQYDVEHYRHGGMVLFLLLWIVGSIVSELVQLINIGHERYINNLWNILDLLVLASFAVSIIPKHVSEGSNPYCLFILKKLPAITLVCALLRRMRVFYLSEFLGKMLLIFLEIKTEVIRFLIIFGYVVLAFACAFCYLYYDVQDGATKPFTTLSSSLLKLSLTMVGLGSSLDSLRVSDQTVTVGGANRNQTYVADLSGIYNFMGITLYAVFTTITIVVLLRLCIAMMSNRYRIIQQRIVKEWYFRRSEIWLDFIRRKIIFPPPYNLVEILIRLLQGLFFNDNNFSNKVKDEPEKRPTYRELLKILVVRYYQTYGKKNCQIHGHINGGRYICMQCMKK
ncbi:short transient receptor potential channel 5-like [Ptychodera flava]|uniref:short transient receptor potential channel 5-like n=1 Tax=Ptychodera flava TaxID=63121 RepID=UPI00396A5DE0